MHLGDGLGDRLMFDGNAVSGDHDSGAICTAPAVNKYFRVRIRVN